MSLRRFAKYKDSLLLLPADRLVSEAIERMVEENAAAVLVVSDDGGLEGIFTDRDVLARIISPKLDPATTRLGEAMTRDVVTLEEDASLDVAIHCMQTHQISHLPILGSEQEIIGMMTIRHLLHDKVKDLVEELNSLEAYLNDAPGG